MPEPVTEVAADELLLRSVRDSEDCFMCDGSGELLQVRTSAFNDRERKPSVDRQGLRQGAPQASKKSPSDGVIALGASEVRGISVATMNKNDEVEVKHAVDVLHRPLDENYAHAQIECAPHVVGDGAWKRLKESLCRIAKQRGWACRPASTCKDLH